MDSYFKRLLRDFSHKSRTRKFELFDAIFQPRLEDRVLDVGASGDVFTQYTFEDVYQYPERIVGGGYELSEVTSARQHYPKPRYAVFEHILGDGRQEQFAREIMRVGKSWFVTTPNYWYPLESHYHLPFIQFMPRPVQREYNRLLGTHIPKGTVQELGLLSARQLQQLFPSGQVEHVRVTFWPETLVAYYVDPHRAAYAVIADRLAPGTPAPLP